MTSGANGAAGPVDLTIVIPAYREEARLPASLRRIAAYLADRPVRLSADVIVVDDGSRDATSAVAAELGRELGLSMKVVTLPLNRGKGFAVRTGALAARGERVLISDADLSTPIEEWEKLAAAGTPVAIGSRALDESLVKVHQPFLRQMMGKLFNRCVRLLAVPGIRDTQCGFKLFSREAAREVFSRASVDRFAWDVEALLIARKLGYAIAEIPVLWYHKEDSRVSLWRGAQAYLDLFRIRWRVRRAIKGAPTTAEDDEARSGG